MIRIDTDQLIYRLQQREVDLFAECDHYDHKNKYGFIDRGGSVLAVAHLDVSPSVKHIADTVLYDAEADDDFLMSPALDDRLGVYVILDLLPEMGLVFDVLLTTDEEIGNSSAGKFVTDKEYDWIFQFDRRGTDVVMYDYETVNLSTLLMEMGFEVGAGSFSDICYLTHLGVAGFNFGVGYHLEHTENCYVNLSDTLEMVEKFWHFFLINDGVKLTYTPAPWQDYRRYGRSYGTYAAYDYTDDEWWEQELLDEGYEIVDGELVSITDWEKNEFGEWVTRPIPKSHTKGLHTCEYCDDTSAFVQYDAHYDIYLCDICSGYLAANRS